MSVSSSKQCSFQYCNRVGHCIHPVLPKAWTGKATLGPNQFLVQALREQRLSDGPLWEDIACTANR